MICPYCVQPVVPGQVSVKVGEFLAHAGCQAEQASACVYLPATGGMVVGGAWLEPRALAGMIEMVAEAKIRALRRGHERRLLRRPLP